MNTNKKEICYDIVNGPNKDILFDACKYACVKDAKVPIKFDMVLGYSLPEDDPKCCCFMVNVTDFKIMGIENEDGSGESFNIRGYAKKEGNQLRFRGYYNTKHRQGFITFFK
ncbi:hypothetical protein IJG22_02955 [Candidatus Saccharibacteria bacterium]|nr:hypothetical protein [Candidatus Saccharibacteria bacterium]